MSWATGLWGWGEADAGEWQALYRIEGARRAWVRSLQRYAAADAGSLAAVQRAWDRGSMGRAAAALRREQRMSAAWRDRRAKGAARMAELANEIAAAGGRNGWVYEQRLLGRTYQAIGGDVGVSRDRARQIYHKEERRRHAWRPECGWAEHLRRRGEEIKGDMEDVLGVARKVVAA